MPSRTSTSTAYWNLRAEQVMDRVFHEAEPSLKAVEIRVEPAPAPAPTSHAVAEPRPSTLHSFQPWQQLTLIGVTLGALLCSAWLARSWQLSEQALYRERNLALTEKLKARNTPSPPVPPKPAEPEAVAILPSLEPLTLPLSAAIAPTSPPPTSVTPTSSADAGLATPAPTSQPALVGVVHAEVGGSAIFQLDNQSLSAAPGESIGNSGWSLLSISSTGAVIERNGERQSLSIGGAF